MHEQLLRSRLEDLGAGTSTIDFNGEHPVGKIKELTRGIGVLRAIDIVEVDACRPEGRSAYAESRAMRSQFKEECRSLELVFLTP